LHCQNFYPFLFSNLLKKLNNIFQISIYGKNQNALASPGAPVGVQTDHAASNNFMDKFLYRGSASFTTLAMHILYQ